MSRRIAAAALAVGAATTILTGLTSTLASAPASAATSAHGCPSGAVCIYPRNAGWNGDKPSVTFYSYGPHNLSDQVGNHYVLNNQHDDGGNPVIVILCKGYGGKDCSGATYYQWSRSTKEGVSWGNPDLTPIDSVVLTVFGP